jgi:hypothetical protein
MQKQLLGIVHRKPVGRCESEYWISFPYLVSRIFASTADYYFEEYLWETLPVPTASKFNRVLGAGLPAKRN